MSDQESIQSEQDLNETLEIQENLDLLILEALADQIDLPKLEEEEEEENPAENESGTSAATTNSSMSQSSATLTDIFGNANALDDAAIASSLSTHKKEDRASMDLKALNRVKYEATKQLDMIFKVQSALGTSGVKGEENPDLDTTVMATVFAENTHVLDKMSRVIEDYDMVSAIQIRKVADPTATHPANNKYEPDYIDLLKEIGTLDLDEVKEYSGDIMKFDKPDGPNRQNLVWLLLLVRNNESSSIAALIEPAFEKQDIHHRNGAVYLKMVLDLCFSIDEHVIESLKVYITRFGKNGLSAFEGENVNMAAVEIIAIARRLDQLGELPNDAPKTVLKGLQKVTHNYEFKQTFNLIGNLQNQSVISFSGSTTNAKPLALIETYFDQAKSLYTSAVLRNQWAGRRPNNRMNNMVNNLVLVCWNCGGNHSLKDCKEEKDQARIQKAKDAFFDNRRKAGAQNHRNKGDGGRDKGYSRPGFGGTKSANGLITTSDGQVYTSCKHGSSADGCGINQTHSSKYHHQWKANPGGFKLPCTHPFMIALAAEGQCLPAPPKGSPSNVTNQGAIHAAVQQALSQFKSETSKKLADLETQAASPDVSHAAGMLMQLFQ